MKPTKFMSMEEKKAVLRNWQRFIKSGFDRKYFTKRLYDHLNLHCYFIAHFDVHGFYGTYFENPEHTLEFLQQFDEDYHDLNSEMAYSLEPYKEKIYAGLKQKTKEMKLKQIERLKSELEGIK